MFSYKYTAFNPAFAGQNNEVIYDGLCAATTPIDSGLAELQARLRPIIISRAEAFLNALTWTLDDALDDAMVLLWEMVRKHSYNPGTSPFHNFFGCSWGLRLNNLFAKAVTRGPILIGNAFMGYSAHQPVYMSVYAEHEKAEGYRRKAAERSARYYRRQREAMGKPVGSAVRLTPEERDERQRERARRYSKQRWASMTREEKDESNAKERARRAAKRATETPEQAEARRAKVRARCARRKAQMTPEQIEAQRQRKRAYDAARKAKALSI